MPNFHNTISRRDFMKATGLVGAGLGTAGVASPIFHDLDEITQNGVATKQPWWIKENDPGKLTVEYDWNLMKNPNELDSMHGNAMKSTASTGLFGIDPSSTWRRTLGQEKSQQVLDDMYKTLHDGVANNRPGFQLRDVALHTGAYFRDAMQPFYDVAPDSKRWGNSTKWQGTPEETSQMIRTAARFYGAANARCGELTTDEHKLFFTHDVDGLPIVFEDVDYAYVTSEKRVLPKNKKYYYISVTIHMSKELFRQGQSCLRHAANLSRYRQWRDVHNGLCNFISVLGYQSFGYYYHPYGLVPSQAHALLSGHAEIARNNNFCISPDWGSVQGYFTLLTTLPLAQSNPIDAGISRFCNTCKKCAEACPQQCISYEDEPSWEIPNSKVAPNAPTTYSTPGKKTYHTDSVACMTQWMSLYHGCGVCMGTCVFNVNSKSMVHQMVKSTIGSFLSLNVY